MANASLSACLAEIKAHPAKFYAYILSRPCGTPFYVGIGKKKRIGAHFHEASRTPHSVKSRVFLDLWSVGLDVEHLVVGFFSSRKEAEQEEIRLIAKFRRHDLGEGPLLNRTDGGEGPANFSPASKERLRQSRLGRVYSEETRRKIGDAHRGKKMSAETKAKMSASRRGRSPCAEAIENSIKANRGRPLTIEHKEKLRLAKLGRRLSEGHRHRIGESSQSRLPTEIDGIKYRSKRKAMAVLGVNRKKLDRLIEESGGPTPTPATP